MPIPISSSSISELILIISNATYSLERNQEGEADAARLSVDIGKIAICERHTEWKSRQSASRIDLYPKGYLPPSIVSLRRGQTARAGDTMAEAQ
jgi:hypothetical protein